MPEAARIVIVRFGSLGDVVKCTALPRLIKARYPASRVAMVTAEPLVELLEGNPHLDRVYGFRRADGLAGVRQLARELRAEGVDLVVDVHHSLRSRVLRRLVGAAATPYSKRTLQRFLLINWGWNTYRPPMQKEADFLAGLRPYGVEDDGQGTELPLQGVEAALRQSGRFQGDMEWLAALRRAGRPVLGLAPVAAWRLKQWPVASFEALAQAYVQATGGGVLVFGGAGDAQAERLAQGLAPHGRSLAGRTSLLESAYFAAQTDVVVANDTGMTHLSEAAGRDVITLFGPTSRELGYFPARPGSVVMERPLHCRPCTRMGEGRCTHPWERACLAGITPQAVLAQVMTKLAGSASPATGELAC